MLWPSCCSAHVATWPIPWRGICSLHKKRTVQSVLTNLCNELMWSSPLCGASSQQLHLVPDHWQLSRWTAACRKLLRQKQLQTSANHAIHAIPAGCAGCPNAGQRSSKANWAAQGFEGPPRRPHSSRGSRGTGRPPRRLWKGQCLVV